MKWKIRLFYSPHVDRLKMNMFCVVEESLLDYVMKGTVLISYWIIAFLRVELN